MDVIVCDLCKKKEANRKFKVKMSTKGYIVRTGYGMKRVDLFAPYEKNSYM